MPNKQPRIVSANGQRTFACSPAAVVALLVNDQEQLLCGYHNKRQRWEAVSGVMEASETVVDAALRELREEMGETIQARPLGVVHASTFRYDDNARYMISIVYLLAYTGGEITPGDDMSDGGYRWLPLAGLNAERPDVGIPREPWLLQRALDLYRLWKGEHVVLQSTLNANQQDHARRKT